MNKLKCRRQKMNGKFECKKTKKIIDIKKCSNCKYKEYKTQACKSNVSKTQYKKTMRVKSSKLAKLEKERYSVFTNDLSTCFYSNKECYGSITKHELFSGRNRQRSMKWGFVLPLCSYHHSTLQNNTEFNRIWHNNCREYWLKNYGNIESFIETFGKSYL